MDVTLRQLRYFVTVADRLHFTAAAEQLFISQPALSKQIRALELQLRVTLFDRDRRVVRLTGAGEALLPQARATLSAWDLAERDLARVVATEERVLTVGMSTGVGRGLLPAARARFSELVPGGELRVRQVPWSDPTGGLSGPMGSGTDLAFVWLPLADPERYAFLEMATEARRVAMPGGHRLSRQPEVAFSELLAEPFLALPASSGGQRDFWLATDQRGGRAPVIGAEVQTTEETVEALAAGSGVVLVAEGNVPLVARDDVVIRPVTGIGPAQLVLAWRRDDRRPSVDAFRAAVRAARGDRAGQDS